MARTLEVFFNQDLCGRLTQNDHGRISFAYHEDWRGDPLSQSLPLRPEPFDHHECEGFFGGILPEQATRQIIAKNLGISRQNDFALLEIIGGECAGVVSFLPSGQKPSDNAADYRPLSPQELAETLRALPRRPLLAGEKDVRLSLAGAQPKLAVRVSEDGAISVPLGGAPSTHILKPALRDYEDIVHNEALCMTLAAQLGLNVAPVKMDRIEDLDYLLVERYDRIAGPPATRRLHQEDFCQALGIPSNMKYQNEGGPSFASLFALLRKASSAPVHDVPALLDAAIFNCLIGNNDAHAKNFSLLYTKGISALQTRLAPLYDLVCTRVYPDLSTKMAMKIGGEYDSEKIFAHHFEAFAEENSLSKPLTKKRVTEMAARLLALVAQHPATPVADLIRSRCELTLKRFEQAA